MCDVECLADEIDEDSDDMEADMICEEEERLSVMVGLKPEWEPFVIAIVATNLAPAIDLFTLDV